MKKKLTERQLIEEIEYIIGKYAKKHSSYLELVSKISSHFTYVLLVQIYTDLAGRSFMNRFGTTADNIVIYGQVEDELLELASGGKSDNLEVKELHKLLKDSYDEITNRINTAIGDKQAYYEPIYSETVSYEALSIVYEKHTGKKLNDLSGLLGFDGFKDYLPVARNTAKFIKRIDKSLKKINIKV